MQRVGILTLLGEFLMSWDPTRVLLLGMQ
uniref:Uncharacterized protein n=1 Tax=Rhizophora mucronata TaxID=61149 RepID=A0A2P2P988_RHIMU